MTADLTATEHRDNLLDVFSEITLDCQQLGLRPIAVEVAASYSGGWTAHVQFHALADGHDVPAVDALAGAYGLAPADPYSSNYTRKGRMDFDGLAVEVTVFTGRPKAVHDPARCVLPVAHLHSCLPAPAGRIAVETTA